jgi:hypothetical protein
VRKPHRAGTEEQIFPLRSTQNRPAQEKENEKKTGSKKLIITGDERPLSGGAAAIPLRPTKPSALPSKQEEQKGCF